jgi:hypothetical protein
MRWSVALAREKRCGDDGKDRDTDGRQRGMGIGGRGVGRVQQHLYIGDVKWASSIVSEIIILSI